MKMEPDFTVASAAKKTNVLERKLNRWDQIESVVHIIAGVMGVSTLLGMTSLNLADAPLEYVRAYGIPQGFLLIANFFMIFGARMRIGKLKESLKKLRDAA